MPTTKGNVISVILAAGNGRRMGGKFKQFLRLRGRPVLVHSIEKFLQLQLVKAIIVVVPETKKRYATQLISRYIKDDRILVVAGGRNRRESMYVALEHINEQSNLKKGVGVILAHDAARPTIKTKDILRIVEEAEVHGGAVAAIPTVDLPLHVKEGMLVTPLKKEEIYRGLTPQGFRFQDLWDAHVRACELKNLDSAADNLEILKATGSSIRVRIVETEDIPKITFPDDMRRVSRILSGNAKVEV
ncbi:MAG: IspD/TarI family cytidylyltransferase [Candidatus Moraniibacteriota bacterium]